jgi:hypothetical protein
LFLAVPDTWKTREILIHFDNTSGANYWGCFLALGKPSSPIAIDINAREFLAVIVVHGDSPVPVLATPVAMEATVRFRFGSCSTTRFLGHWIL